MGNNQNPYQAYTDGTIFSDSPLSLVVKLYQGAIDATRQAEKALQARDIPARSRAINKAISILSELLIALDFERGGEISQNLKRLYTYMQQQLLNAHFRQVAEPLVEVEKLLNTLLEGWREVENSQYSTRHHAPALPVEEVNRHSEAPSVSAPVYSSYLQDVTSFAVTAYSF